MIRAWSSLGHLPAKCNQCSDFTPVFIGTHRHAPLSPMKEGARVRPYTVPMVPMHLPSMVPMNLVEQIRARQVVREIKEEAAGNITLCTAAYSVCSCVCSCVQLCTVVCSVYSCVCSRVHNLQLCVQACTIVLSQCCIVRQQRRARCGRREVDSRRARAGVFGDIGRRVCLEISAEGCVWRYRQKGAHRRLQTRPGGGPHSMSVRKEDTPRILAWNRFLSAPRMYTSCVKLHAPHRLRRQTARQPAACKGCPRIARGKPLRKKCTGPAQIARLGPSYALTENPY
jgi:hypothetical protein